MEGDLRREEKEPRSGQVKEVKSK